MCGRVGACSGVPRVGGALKSWGRGAKRCVFDMGMKKHPLYRVGTGGVGWVLLCECALCEVGVARGGH